MGLPSTRQSASVHVSVRDWLVANGAEPELVAYGSRFFTRHGLWAALAHDAHGGNTLPTDVQRAAWLAWVATRPGAMPEHEQTAAANRVLNTLKTEDGISVMRVIINTAQAGLDLTEGAAIDAIEESQEPPAAKTMLLAARAATWPSKPSARPTAYTWAQWRIGRILAGMECPFND